MKNKLLLLLLPLLPASLSAELEIRDASYSPVQGYIESIDTSGKEERKVYLDSAVLLSSKEVESAFVSKNGDTYAISVTFSDEGSKKLKKITEQRFGKKLAFIIDGEVLSVPTVMGILSKKAMITGSYSEAEAEGLAKKILSHNQSLEEAP
ncbi:MULTISPECIES: SecDF P1 head subdomain-containing protein [unclassified Lentimonas]|uniref:SecDF P1 head subdomain-containing protein n=1 Tax=unclassified Lentimonas TaxID=2630993 RepID=UPI001389E4DA|nr:MULTISPECIES: hypothetical protein [unclassified Lentimonas]